jgi:hypothetical protein
MTDNAEAARTTPATSDNFRRAAELAGTNLRERLEKDSEIAIHSPTFDSYSTKYYGDVLGEVMDKFTRNVCGYNSVRFRRSITHACQQEFPRLHAGGSLIWLSIRLITQDGTAGRNKISQSAVDVWALPLFAGGDSIIGQPLSRNNIAEVKKGQIFLGYKVICA